MSQEAPTSERLRLEVYGDFNCPYSALASARIDVLLARGEIEIEWRAVEHDPTIPKPSRPVTGELAEQFDREVDEVRGFLATGEAFPIRRPPVQPNTARAITAFAAVDADERDRVRTRLFGALWFEGRDTGDAAVVADLAGDTRQDPTPTVAVWRDGWMALERRLVPMMVLPDGTVSRGLGALSRLGRLLAGETPA